MFSWIERTMNRMADVVTEEYDDAPPPYSAEFGEAQSHDSEVISQRLLQDNEACYKNSFSCGDPVVELIERAARILLTVILGIYLGLTLITISSPNTYSSNGDDNDRHDVVPVITVLILSLLLTSIGLVCEIPVVVAQCRSSHLLNRCWFRILDIVKWITLILAFIILFCYWYGVPHESEQGNTGLLITLLVFCGITMGMGLTVVIWDCGHLMIGSVKLTASSVATV